MTDISQLWNTRRPWLHVLPEGANVSHLRMSAPIQPAVVVEFDGGSMRGVDEFFREFVREFHFPEYFGWNWPAYGECMGNLEWMSARAYLVLVSRPELLLSESPTDRDTFFRIINGVCSRWANSFGLAADWGGGEVPFNVGLLCGESVEDSIRGVVGAYL